MDMYGCYGCPLRRQDMDYGMNETGYAPTAGAGSGTPPAPGAGYGTAPGAGTTYGMAPGAGTGYGMGSGTSAGLGMSPGVGAGFGMAPGAGTGLGMGSDSGAGLGMGPGAGAGFGMAPVAGTNYGMMGPGMAPESGTGYGMTPAAGYTPAPADGAWAVPGAMPYSQMPGYPQVLWQEMESERDMHRLWEMYPEAAKDILPYVQEECDKMEYEGSIMYDEYPDRVMVSRIRNSIYDRVQDRYDLPQEGTPDEVFAMNRETARRYPPRKNWLGDLIDVLLFQEMHRRRCRRRNCRGWR